MSLRSGWVSGAAQRGLDIVVAVTALILLSWVMVIIALLVRTKLGKPVLFRQARAGQHGEPFRMVKFRSMTDARDAAGNPLPDADRLTRFGRFLRAASLDELPELWNVLRGDMSIVGPRPLLLQYVPRYNEFQRRRLEARPGITGWAQINGRNAISWDERFALDIWYVDNRSVWLDLKIMFLTVLKVARRDGISAQGEATMSMFEGESGS